MTSLILHVKTPKPFPDEAEAVRALTALAEVLGRSSLRGGLWTEISSVRLDLSAPTFEHGLGASRWIRADLPRQPTHFFAVHAAARGPTEIGSLSISVRNPAPEGSFPGLSAVLKLSEDVFDTRIPALEELIERCVDAASASSVMIGPRRWVLEEGAAWALFAPRMPRERLPAGSRSAVIRRGVVIVAHEEEPASESGSAHESARRVRDVLRVEAPAVPPFLAATPPGVGGNAVVPTPAVTFAAEALLFDPRAEGHALPSQGSRWQPGVTADIDMQTVLQAAVPFGHQGQPRVPAAPVASTAPSTVAAPPRGVGETMDVDMKAIVRAVLSFSSPTQAPTQTSVAEPSVPCPTGQPVAPPRSIAATGESPAPVAPMVPALTLKQYASLSVDMELNSAQAANVLHRYGTNEAGKRLLDEQWARVFYEQPAQRAAFEESKVQYRAWLSRGGQKG